jgi:hypothetical protein
MRLPFGNTLLRYDRQTLYAMTKLWHACSHGYRVDDLCLRMNILISWLIHDYHWHRRARLGQEQQI